MLFDKIDSAENMVQQERRVQYATLTRQYVSATAIFRIRIKLNDSIQLLQSCHRLV